MTTTDSTLPLSEPGTAPAPARRNLFQIFLGVLITPRSTFVWLRDHGNWTWLLPLALLLTLTLILRAVAGPIEQRQFEEAMSQLQQQLGEGGGEGGVFFSGPIGAAGTPGESVQINPANNFLFSYGLPIGQALAGWFFSSLLLLALAWLLGGRPSPGSMFRLSAWALIPNIFRLVVVIAAMSITQRIPAQGLANLMSPPNAFTTSEGTAGDETDGPVMVFVGPGDPAGNFQGPSFGEVFMGGLLSGLDIYSLWSLILLIIGVTVTARISWIKGSFATLLVWLSGLMLGTLPILLGPMLGGLMGGPLGGPMIVGP